MRGPRPPPPPFVSHCQHFPNPPSPLCQTGRFLWCTSNFRETWTKTESISCEHNFFLNPEIRLKPSPVNIKILCWWTPAFLFWCTTDFDVHQRILYWRRLTGRLEWPGGPGGTFWSSSLPHLRGRPQDTCPMNVKQSLTWYVLIWIPK